MFCKCSVSPSTSTDKRAQTTPLPARAQRFSETGAASANRWISATTSKTSTDRVATVISSSFGAEIVRSIQVQPRPPDWRDRLALKRVNPKTQVLCQGNKPKALTVDNSSAPLDKQESKSLGRTRHSYPVCRWAVEQIQCRDAQRGGCHLIQELENPCGVAVCNEQPALGRQWGQFDVDLANQSQCAQQTR